MTQPKYTWEEITSNEELLDWPVNMSVGHLIDYGRREALPIFSNTILSKAPFPKEAEHEPERKKVSSVLHGLCSQFLPNFLINAV